jgi:hypothetical protein
LLVSLVLRLILFDVVRSQLALKLISNVFTVIIDVLHGLSIVLVGLLVIRGLILMGCHVGVLNRLLLFRLLLLVLALILLFALILLLLLTLLQLLGQVKQEVAAFTVSFTLILLLLLVLLLVRLLRLRLLLGLRLFKVSLLIGFIVLFGVILLSCLHVLIVKHGLVLVLHHIKVILFGAIILLRHLLIVNVISLIRAIIRLLLFLGLIDVFIANVRGGLTFRLRIVHVFVFFCQHRVLI